MIDIAVILTCYNQEEYIGQAIESVLMQDTAATFKLFIHDDASTDSSQSIIMEYKNKYRQQIEVILQTENLMSKGFNTWLDTVFPNTDSTYIALLEGDDFWTSDNKLEAQYKAMEENDGIDLCFHECLSLVGSVLKKPNFSYPQSMTIISPSQMIKKGGSYARTASLFFRASAINSGFVQRFRQAPVGDRGLQIFLTLDKGALFVPGISAVYRIASRGSWTNVVYGPETFSHRVKMTTFYSYVCAISKPNCVDAFAISTRENLKYMRSLLMKGKIYTCLLFMVTILKIYM